MNFRQFQEARESTKVKKYARVFNKRNFQLKNLFKNASFVKTS